MYDSRTRLKSRLPRFISVVECRLFEPSKEKGNWLEKLGGLKNRGSISPNLFAKGERKASNNPKLRKIEDSKNWDSTVVYLEGLHGGQLIAEKCSDNCQLRWLTFLAWIDVNIA